jgi:hypothetical protein
MVTKCTVFAFLDLKTGPATTRVADVIAGTALYRDLMACTMWKHAFELHMLSPHFFKGILGSKHHTVALYLFQRAGAVIEHALLVPQSRASEAIFASDAVETQRTVNAVGAILEKSTVIATTAIHDFIATFTIVAA